MQLELLAAGAEREHVVVELLEGGAGAEQAQEGAEHPQLALSLAHVPADAQLDDGPAGQGEDGRDPGQGEPDAVNNTRLAEYQHILPDASLQVNTLGVLVAAVICALAILPALDLRHRRSQAGPDQPSLP